MSEVEKERDQDREIRTEVKGIVRKQIESWGRKKEKGEPNFFIYNLSQFLYIRLLCLFICLFFCFFVCLFICLFVGLIYS